MPLLRASLASSPVTAATSSGSQVAPRADGQGRQAAGTRSSIEAPRTGRPVRDGQRAQPYRGVCRGVPRVRAGEQRDFVVEGNCLVTGKFPEEERGRLAALFARGVLVISTVLSHASGFYPELSSYRAAGHEAGVRCRITISTSWLLDGPGSA